MDPLTQQLVASYGAALVPGDPAVNGLYAILPGSLASDGHLAPVKSSPAVSLSTPATASFAGSVALTEKVSPKGGRRERGLN